MTKNEWNKLPITSKRLVLSDISETTDEHAGTDWDALPYWLRRTLTHFR